MTPTPEQVLPLDTAEDYARLLAPVLGKNGAISDLCGDVTLWHNDPHDTVPSTIPLTGAATDWQYLAGLALEAALHYESRSKQQATALAEAQEREALAGLASSMAADIAYFELQEQRCLAEEDTEAGARYQARLRVLRPYLIRIEGLIEFVALKGATNDE